MTITFNYNGCNIGQRFTDTFMLFLTRALIKANYKDRLLVLIVYFEYMMFVFMI